MENDQKIVFRLSEINARIILIVLWISLIILYIFHNNYHRFFDIFRFNSIAEKFLYNIYLKEQRVINQLMDEIINGKELSRIKLLTFDLLKYLSKFHFSSLFVEIIMLMPVLIIIANLFIKKILIKKINIIGGFIYVILGILNLFYGGDYYMQLNYIILCIVEILVSSLIIIKSIQWLKKEKNEI